MGWELKGKKSLKKKKKGLLTDIVFIFCTLHNIKSINYNRQLVPTHNQILYSESNKQCRSQLKPMSLAN